MRNTWTTDSTLSSFSRWPVRLVNVNTNTRSKNNSRVVTQCWPVPSTTEGVGGPPVVGGFTMGSVDGRGKGRRLVRCRAGSLPR